VVKNRYTRFVDRSGKRLWENDKVLLYIEFMKSWVEGKVIFKDDIPRIASRYTTEILDADTSPRIKKVMIKKEKIVFKKEDK